MPTTCLICCQDAQFFLLPPCNHKQMCWKCCIKLIEGSTFTCPYCNGTPQGTSCILFVDEKEMQKYTFQQILKRNPFKSAAKDYQFYSNQKVANFIEEETSFFCRFCHAIFDNLNFLKKHLNQVHRKQFCNVCLQNRKCLLQEQYLYSDGELTSHMKKGQYLHENQILLYHPYCDFCKERFYDLDAFRAHLRMSSHLKCQICQLNFPKYKYVYYKDYSELQKHFKKSHFVCETGNCLGNKLQNVFVSQALLQQHKNRVHNRNGKATQKQVLNLLLFDSNVQEQLEWDKIGRDFSKEFSFLEKPSLLKNEDHRDSIIDIRAFYPNQISTYNKLSLQQIKQKLFEHIDRPDFKSEVVNITSVPIFNPLEMSSCYRIQLQKFLRDIFNPKFSQPMIETFFTRKFDYRSENQYFSEIKRRMWSFSPISFYYVFPQLIRYFKQSNKTKLTMDNYYAQSLRSLKINRSFIFHQKQHYTDILNILHEQIQSHLLQLSLEQKIDLDIYTRYLKDLNPQFYHNNHQKIFYVQKQKMKNIYHMVEKTKVNQLLKMNWLLKLGLSNESHKSIYDKFYYQTLQSSGSWVKCMSLQELALMYAYVQACLQSLIDKNTYNLHKDNPQSLFLGSVLINIKARIPSKEMTSLRQIQQKSVELAAKLNSYTVTSKKKGILVNEQEHPSLLSFENNHIKEDEQVMTIFGQQVRITPPSHYRSMKKNANHNIKSKEQQQQAQFPQLIKTKVQKKEEIVEEQDFPVFNYKESPQKSQKKPKTFKNEEDDKRTNIEKMGLFNPKNDFISHRMAEQFYKKKQTTKNEIIKPMETENQGWDSQWPTLNQKQSQQFPKSEVNIKKSTKKKKREQSGQAVAMQNDNKIEEQKQIPEELLIKKKTKQQLKAEQEYDWKKLKGKKAKQQITIEHEKSTKEEQQKNVKKQKRRKKVRLDATDSEEQQRKKQEQKNKARQQKFRKFEEEEKLKQSLKYHQDFDSLLQYKKEAGNNNKSSNVSIINSLIESSRVEAAEPEIKIKKGKKGKAVIIEKVDIWKL